MKASLQSSEEFANQAGFAINAGEYSAAFELAKRSLAINSKSHTGLLNLVIAVLKADFDGEYEQCLDLLSQFESELEEMPLYHSLRIELSSRLQYGEKFEIFLATARKKFPEDSVFAFQAALNLSELGDFDACLNIVKPYLLKSQPHLGMFLLYARCKKFKEKEDYFWLEIAENLVKKDFLIKEKSQIYYVLAKYFDDLAQYQLAAKYLSMANELRKKMGAAYLPNQTEESLHVLYESGLSVNRAYLTNMGTNFRAIPIFILGLPRSGSTLLQELLCCEYHIESAGESYFWRAAHNQLIAPVKPERFISRQTPYIKTLHTSQSFYIEKLPENWMSVSFIKNLVPESKFIFLNRQREDLYLSIYFQDFKTHHNYSTDLKWIAHFHSMYLRYQEIYLKHYPEDCLSFDYSQLVKESRSVIDVIGYKFGLVREKDPLGLDSVRKIKTASKWQVRQPLYATSLGKSRNYKDVLKFA